MGLLDRTVASVSVRDEIPCPEKLEVSTKSSSLFQDLDPMVPLYMRSREQRARAPEPVEYHGRLHDIMGVSKRGELLLRDQRAIHQDVRLEDFAGRFAVLDDTHWRVVSLDAILEPTLMEMIPILRLVDPNDSSYVFTVSEADMSRVRFSSDNGEYKPGRIKHGIMRLISVMPRTRTRVPLHPGQCFQARLRRRELQGRFVVKVNADGQLTATGLDANGRPRHIAIKPSDIAPRYKRVASLDFGSSFDVDTFVFHEDQLRGQATYTRTDSDQGPIQDPLFGTLSAGGTMPELTNGAEHLAVFEQYIRKHTQPPESSDSTAAPRRLTILNLSMSNQGAASCVLDALIEFRRQNPTAQICLVVSKLGPTDFQQSPAFQDYMDILAENRIEVDDYTGAGRQTRQVMHGKAITIDGNVLFSTGAVMDTQPINKADFALELPRPAATVFQRYVDEAVHNNATPERCAELAAELAALGVVINDPVTGLTYISRAQNALIRGARNDLLVSLSELVDPAITKVLVQRAASGVNVTIQIRELDPVSARMLATCMKHHPNLRLEDSSWWEPRPHWNAIVADGTAAYIGSSYLWSTQRNMVHQGRSFENGVLLEGEAVDRLCGQINELRSRNMAATVCHVSNLWRMQYSLCVNIQLFHAQNILGRILFDFPRRNTMYNSTFEKETTGTRALNCTTSGSRFSESEDGSKSSVSLRGSNDNSKSWIRLTALIRDVRRGYCVSLEDSNRSLCILDTRP